MADEKKEDIIVKAPSRPVTAPEKKAETTAERALEEERYGVLSVPARVGTYLGVLSVSVCWNEKRGNDRLQGAGV